jgi:hypothetical protein
VKREVWFPGFILVAFVFLMIQGLSTLPFRGMLFPLIVGGAGALLCGFEIVRDIAGSKEPVKEEKGRSLLALKTHIPVLAIAVLLVPMIWILGFMVAVPVHLLLFLRYNGEKWFRCFAIAFSSALICYFGLHLAMGIDFNEGLLLDYLKG